MHSSTTISADGTPLHVYRWPAPCSATGIFFIIHGMAEHGRRYTLFAEQLAARGLDVYAFDLRGHGGTTEAIDHGYIGTGTRWQMLLDDVAAVHACALETSGCLPVILLGHSLGSFIAQAIMQSRGRNYAAIILSGTAMPSRLSCYLGAIVAAAESARVDPTGRSALMRALSFGAYEKAIKRRTGNRRTRFDWLSSEEKAVDAYVEDPDTGFDMRASTWQRLLPGIAGVQSPRARRQAPMNLPLLIASGEDDPVGKFGRSPRRLACAYDNSGQRDVTTLVYAGARHELLHDTTAALFTHDLLAWLAERGLVHNHSTETVCEAS